MEAKKPKKTAAIRLWLERPGVRLGFGFLALILAYVFASWAIDSGSLLDYAIALLLIIYGIRELWDVLQGRVRKTNGR